MERNLKNCWRDSPRYRVENESIVISESDDDVESSVLEFNSRSSVIDESHSDVDVSENTTLKKNESNYDTSVVDDDTPVARLKKKTMKRIVKKYRIIDSDDSTNDDENEEEYHTLNDSHNDSENSDSDEYLPDNDYDSSNSQLLVKNKGKKRKDITHDNTREDIKELKLNSSSEIFSNMNFVNNNNSHKQDDSDNEILDARSVASHDIPVTIELDSDSGSGRNSESELARSFAKQEIGVGNVDPLVAQKRAIINCKLDQLQNQLTTTKLLLTEGNIEVLPDKGDKLRASIREQEKEIEDLTLELENTPLVQSFNSQGIKAIEESHLAKKEPLFIKDESLSDYENHINLDDDMMRPTTFPELKELGKHAQATREKELALTVERLQDLHGSLIARPSEDEKVEDPKGLRVRLMPHQQHALAWLLWREQQRPAGGVLADDMGLGKTLTMISLIMATLANKDLRDESDSDDEWNNDRRPLHQKGGTLIVCPASLLSQWEYEVRNKCKRGLLSVEVYHGSNRESVPKRLARNNMVITTYNILAREYKVHSTLYKINWKRVILDEAHIVRNHKSQASEAVCGLVADKRWALTGTPIQNKELDLYSILKFLKCSPFDDLRVWRRWVDNKNAAGHQRLATVMKTLMLRRTKQELMAKGELESLPDKSIEEVVVKLDPQEQLVYEKILIYSRTLFAQFLAQRAEKEHNFDLYRGKYDQPAYLSNPNKGTQFTKAQSKLLAMHADVKTHEILVLLLRLRQVCCHPALIYAMLDQEDVKQSGIMDTENVDPELLSLVNNMSLNGIDNPEEEEENTGINKRIVQNVLTTENPVFEDDRISSKMRALLKLVEEILQRDDDKLIIVSQWTTLLNVIASHLPSIKGATFSKFTGSVAIKDRQGITESFNSQNSGPRILLLSLTAGGVGLNLIGANHLLLFDNHWNPQLETQAQDRIYRFGQTKNVYIYKFMCVNTIEERIKALQERKLEIAQNVLSGDKSKAVAKLTLNDLKSLFGF